MNEKENHMKTTIQFNGDGSYTFLQYINGTKYTLDKYGNYTAWHHIMQTTLHRDGIWNHCSGDAEM